MSPMISRISVHHSASLTLGPSDIVTRNPRGGLSRMIPFSKTPMAVGACVERARQKARSGSRIPTNTTSPSPISRAAATTISSSGVQGSARIVDRGGEAWMPGPQAVESRRP